MICEKTTTAALNGHQALGERARNRLRQRGFGLMEVSLAIIASMALFVIAAGFVRDEQESQKRLLLAGEHGMILDAARSYVTQNYFNLQVSLFHAAQGGGPALLSVSSNELIAGGYLPKSMADDDTIMNRLHEQIHTLLLRAVDRSDTSIPQASMYAADIDPGNTGGINPALVDRDPDNGEMDIEAVLVTHGGNVIKRADGGNMVGRMSSSFGGFITAPDETSGPYGSFTLDISPFSTLPEYPGVGHFASIVALSPFGVLGMGGDGDGMGVIDPFRRCEGVDIGSALFSDCIESNEVYTDIVLKHQDTNNDGTIDMFPAIRGLTMIECADNESAMGEEDSFQINCGQTNVKGHFSVSGVGGDVVDIDLENLKIREDEVSFHDEDVITRTDVSGTDKNIVRPDRLVMNDVNDGQDLAEAIISTMVLASGQTIKKPVCTGKALDGSGVDIDPRIYVYPASYSEEYGRSIVGVRAYAEDIGTEWRVRLMAFVGQDFCDNDPNNPIQSGYPQAANGPKGAPGLPFCSTWTDPLTIDNQMGNSQADVYELASDYGRVIAQTRCF